MEFFWCKKPDQLICKFHLHSRDTNGAEVTEDSRGSRAQVEESESSGLPILGKNNGLKRGTDCNASAIRSGEKRWIFICVYVALTDEDSKQVLYSSKSKMIRTKAEKTDYILMAEDKNRHIPRFDGKWNSRGKLLDNFSKVYEMVIFNDSERCQRKYTRKNAKFIIRRKNKDKIRRTLRGSTHR